MPNRPSEPQLIADELDNLVPFVARKLKEDGSHDSEDIAIIARLSAISARQLQHAEVLDLTWSLGRLGFNERNSRRLRDIAPMSALPPSAA
jgi:hypothetical protein